MNEVNKTLFIPLYGKSLVSKKHIILDDPTAEMIWAQVGFPIKGKSKSKWLAYNMAMRARVFDDWVEQMLQQNESAAVLHIGCGLDSRCQRIKHSYKHWYDCDFPEVIALRKKYYIESDNYHMIDLDASKPEQMNSLPDHDTAIVVLEGISMYLGNNQLQEFLNALQEKYPSLHILMDVYTVFGAKASKYKNPVNDVGVSKLYGVDDIDGLLAPLKIKLKKEHTFTPSSLVQELKPSERFFFKVLFSGAIYRKFYRLFELEC